MNQLRALLGIIGGASAGYAVALFILCVATPTTVGAAIAISAACVLGWGLVRAIQADREADRERMRRGRAEVWARRDAACSWPLCSFEDHQCPEARRESA